MTNRIGAYLRQKREEQHLTLQQVAEHTGIRENYLTALEEGHFSKIPGDVFIRGFLRNYGNYLGLDGNLVVEVYRMDLNPEKILGKLATPLQPVEAEPVKQEESTPQDTPALSDTIIVAPGMFPVSGQEAATPEAEAVLADAAREPAPATPEDSSPVQEAKQEQPAEVQPVVVDAPAEEPVSEGEQAAVQEEDEDGQVNAAAAAALAAEKLNKEQEARTREEAGNREEAAAAGTAAAAGSSGGKIQSLIDTVKDFIDENLYETVLDDEDEDETAQDDKEGAAAPEPAKPAFSFKVFSGVFLVCLLIFTVVMAYFIFGGKTQEELKPTTKITDGVKSDHSSEKSEEAKKAEAEKAAKEAEAKKKAEEEKKKKQATNKTLGLGSKVTVQIKYKKAVWTHTHVDGKVVEAVVVPAGSTRTYKGDREVRLNLGSIRDVEIHVNGKLVPYGEKEWGVANKVFTPRS